MSTPRETDVTLEFGGLNLSVIIDLTQDGVTILKPPARNYTALSHLKLHNSGPAGLQYSHTVDIRHQGDGESLRTLGNKTIFMARFLRVFASMIITKNETYTNQNIINQVNALMDQTSVQAGEWQNKMSVLKIDQKYSGPVAASPQK